MLEKIKAFLDKSWSVIVLVVSLIVVALFIWKFSKKGDLTNTVQDMVEETKTKIDTIEIIKNIKTQVADEKREETNKEINKIQKVENTKERLNKLNELMEKLYNG